MNPSSYSQALDMQPSIELASTILMYSCFSTFILGALKSKALAVEMIIEIQIVYYSLVVIQDPNPAYIGLYGMRFIGGFYVDTNPSTLTIIPSNYSSLGFSSNFWNNYNVMLSSFLICPFLGAIFYILSKLVRTILSNRKLLRYVKECLCELLLYVCFYNTTRIIISWIVNIQYQNNSAGAIALGTIMVIVILVEIVLFTIFRNHYKEFREQYHQKPSAKIYPHLLMTKTILCSFFLALQSLTQCSIYIVIAIQFIFLVYMGICRPHMQFMNYIKQIINLSLVIVCFCFNAYAFQTRKSTDTTSQFSIYIPSIILSILYLILIIHFCLILKCIGQSYIQNWLSLLKFQRKESDEQKDPIGIEEGIGQKKMSQIEAEMMKSLLKHHRQNEKKMRFNLSNMVERQQPTNDSFMKKVNLLHTDFT